MLLTERYADQIDLVLSSFDRVVLMGTLPDFCHAQAATRELYRQIRIFDFPKFANGIREAIRAHAETLAAESEADSELVPKTHTRKEDLVERVLARRGTDPGLVHILSAMESCTSYQLWHDKRTRKTYLRPDSGKCLHYYFYFMDEELGLCYLRVPTWAPFLEENTNGYS